VSAENRAWAAERIAAAQRLWLGVDRALPLTEEFIAFREGLEDEFVHCANFVDQADLSLDLYARSETFCPTEETAITYVDDLALLQYDAQHEADSLTLELLWRIPAMIPPATYNLALHLTPPDSEVPVAQADIPLPQGSITPLSTTLDLASLPPGTYQLALIVYDWQTATRLPGTYNETTAERVLLDEIMLR